MIHPVRDSRIALFLLLAGLAAFAFGLSRLSEQGADDVAGGIALAVGGLVAFFSALILVNFRIALRRARQMQRGEGVIARWTAPADTIDAYLQTEAARPRKDRSLWRPKPGQPAEIIFTADAVLAGGRYHGLSSQGIQTFVAVNLVYGSPVLIEFTNQQIATGPADRLVTQISTLRVPISRGADETAGKVLAHFQRVLSGETRVNPGFWQRRLRIGLVAVVLGVLAGGLGWTLAERSGWRADDAAGTASLVLLIAGPLVGLGGLILAAIAAVARRKPG